MAELPGELSPDERQRQEAERINIGTKIRRLRARRMLTMEVVAQKAGCSRAFLSRVERNESMPSVATLVDVARALEVPVGVLFDESEAERAVVVRASERSGLQDDGVLIETLTRDVMTRKMVLYRLLLEESADVQPKLHKYHDEVLGLVLAGRVRLCLEQQQWDLAAGDTFYIDAPSPYRVENTGSGPAEIILTNCKRTY
jgi:transcriptional regulator with XRE-family HTH domain